MGARTQSRSFPDWSSGVGTAATADGLTVEEVGSGPLNQTVLSLSSFVHAVTDSGANGGHGSDVLYTFPEGHVKLIGAHINATFTAGTTGFTTTATHEIGLGSTATATDNAALTTTEEDILTGIAGDLTSSAIALGSADSTDLTLDGSATAAVCRLNSAWAADDCSASDTVSVTGTITLTWINLGDD